MLGRVRRAQLDAARAAAMEGVPRHLRRPRLDTMRFYRRQRMWRALRRARYELAARRGLRSALLLLTSAAVLTLHLVALVHWLHR